MYSIRSSTFNLSSKINLKLGADHIIGPPFLLGGITLRRISYEDVKLEFEKNGCVLLSHTYVNNSDKLKYVCICGNESEIRYADFRRGRRCVVCGINKVRAARTKYDVVFMQEYFSQRNCTLLEDTYYHVDYPMRYICECNSESMVSFSNFKAGKRCVACGTKKSADSGRQSLEQVRKIFKDAGCEMLSDVYKDSHSPLRYTCACKNTAVTTLARFKSGSRCQKCKRTRLSGENSPHWNPELTDAEREYRRDVPGYREWRDSVYERDDYTCQSCGVRGEKINAHHLENYSENKALRLDVNNGITLCYPCHRAFHKMYGFRRNNKLQIDEFIATHRQSGGAFLLSAN